MERFVSNVESLVVGDPMDPDTDVGPLISHGDRDRVKEWIDEAAQSGGEVLTGGELTDDDRCLEPTVIREPPRDARVVRRDLRPGRHASFGSFEEAIEMANDARFGLQAGCSPATSGWRSTPAAGSSSAPC